MVAYHTPTPHVTPQVERIDVAATIVWQLEEAMEKSAITGAQLADTFLARIDACDAN